MKNQKSKIQNLKSKVPISVIIPAYNAEQFIREAIESVRAQTVGVTEIIVVDNNSTDRTRQIAEELGASVVAEKKQLLAAARNAGIAACRQEWIALLDADDVWKRKKIEYQWEAIQTCPAARIISCDYTLMNVASGLKFDLKRRRHGRAGVATGRHCRYFPRIDARLLEYFGFLPSGAVVHREVFAETGAFDETLPSQEDVEFFMRAAAHYPFAVVRKRLVYYRRHAENQSRDIKGREESLRLLTRRMLRFPDNYADGAGQFYLERLKKLFVGRALTIALQRKQSAFL